MERDDRTLKQLLEDLVLGTRRLFSQELSLLKAETRESLRQLGRGVTLLVLGGIVGLAAALLLLDTLNRGLTVLLAPAVGIGVAVWLAPLLLALAFGAVAFLLIRRATAILEAATMKPEQTVESLQEDARWIRTRAS